MTLGNLAVAVAVVGAAGCISNAVEPKPAVAGAVAGQVTNPAGNPVLNATVNILLVSQPVNNTSQILGSASLLSDAAGRYLVNFVIIDKPEQTGLLQVGVQAPFASGLLNADTAGISLRLTRAFPPPDTTVVNIQLVARP